MVAGRVSAAIAAELGTMRVTEQIDALTTLSTNPFKYLIAPRIVAAVICMPLLVAIADAIGVMGGFIVSVQSLDFNSAVYLKNTVDFLEPQDVTSGLIKAAVFGFIIGPCVKVNGCILIPFSFIRSKSDLRYIAGEPKLSHFFHAKSIYLSSCS